jgi:hypothetical protein
MFKLFMTSTGRWMNNLFPIDRAIVLVLPSARLKKKQCLQLIKASQGHCFGCFLKEQSLQLVKVPRGYCFGSFLKEQYPQFVESPQGHCFGSFLKEQCPQLAEAPQGCCFGSFLKEQYFSAGSGSWDGKFN